MDFHWKNREYYSSPQIRAFRIFLLILIVIGIALILTENSWLPAVDNYILGTPASY